MVPRRTRSRIRTIRTVAALAVAALLVAACGGGQDTGESPSVPSDEAGATGAAELAVAIASFDIAVGDDQRLIAGLLSPEREVLAYGEVTFQLAQLGDDPSEAAEISQETTARFLPVPGMEPTGGPAEPALLAGDEGSGVYAGEVDLDAPGLWGLRVVADLADGTVMEGRTTFAVLPETEVPDVGDDAPRSENLTVADVEAGRAAPVSLDSRAQDQDASIPDRHLHATTIADSIDAGRPAVVIVATPVYCVSRFCGPLVETLAQTATRFEDRADFVHLEVWEDFESQQLNAAAAEWIQTSSGGNEPWVFLVGADGRVAARWDNVLALDDLEARLQALPALPAAEAMEAPRD